MVKPISKLDYILEPSAKLLKALAFLLPPSNFLKASVDHTVAALYFVKLNYNRGKSATELNFKLKAIYKTAGFIFFSLPTVSSS